MMKKVLKALLSSLYWVLYNTGIFAACARLVPAERLILTYHNILPDQDYQPTLENGVSHDATTFARQLSLLKRYKNVVAGFGDTGRGTCLITFDDGFRNNLLAARILEGMGVRGIFFVPVQPLVTGSTLVVDRVLMWLSHVPSGVYQMPWGGMDIGAGRAAAWSQAYAWMLDHPDIWDELPAMLDAAHPFASLGLSANLAEQRYQPMSMDDLDRLKAAGHLVGLHSWDHRPLSRLSERDLADDFSRCEELRQQIANINVYSYPFGGVDEVDERTVRMCEQYGYEGAVINTSRWMQVEPGFQMERVSFPMGIPDHELVARIVGVDRVVRRLVGL